MTTADRKAADAALREANAALARGDTALAESLGRDALVLQPDDAAAWMFLGIALRQRDPIAAHAALTRALELDPHHPDARFHLGNLYRGQRRFAEAIAAYEAVLARAPAHPGLQNNLGLALEGAGEPERALAAYRAALAGEPGHRQSLGNLAHLLCRLRRYAEAATLCNEYLRRFPDADATVWVDLGICQHHAGDYAGAEESFERALARAPGDAVILTNLGSLFVDSEDYVRAESVLARAIAQDTSLLYASSLLALSKAQLCAWSGLDALHERIRRALDAGSDDAVNAFAALSIPLPPATQLRVARRWARDLMAPAARAFVDGGRTGYYTFSAGGRNRVSRLGPEVLLRLAGLELCDEELHGCRKRKADQQFLDHGGLASHEDVRGRNATSSLRPRMGVARSPVASDRPRHDGRILANAEHQMTVLMSGGPKRT